jgi:hypothetical protein
MRFRTNRLFGGRNDGMNVTMVTDDQWDHGMMAVPNDGMLGFPQGQIDLKPLVGGDVYVKRTLGLGPNMTFEVWVEEHIEDEQAGEEIFVHMLVNAGAYPVI